MNKQFICKCNHSEASSLFVFYHAVLLVFPERPPCPSLSKYQQSRSFTILLVYEYFCSTPSLSVLENWVFSSLSFETRFWVLAVSGFFRTYITFNVLAQFHFSVSYSASVKGTVAKSMLFAPVPYNASINKSSASHFCPVRIRILWLLAAMNCWSLPFMYPTLCGHASLSPPSLPSLSFPLPTHSNAVPFLRLLFSKHERDCRE